MNLKNLTKEQKQKYSLIAIVAAAGLFAVKQFGISPLLASHAASKEELRTLKEKLGQAEIAVKHDEDVSAALAASKARLQVAARDLIPSPGNTLAWATKTLYAHARALGIDIESVSDLEVDAGGFTAKDQEKRVYKPYGVRMVTQCSYDEVSRLVQALESGNPYVSVSGITISGQMGSPGRHQILLNIEWPNWKSAEKSRGFMDEAKNEQT